jgi:hypothetical protein
VAETIVHFKGEGDKEIIQEITFLNLPKVGETVYYKNREIGTYFKVDKIIHNVDIESNESTPITDIYVSKEITGS